MIKPFQTNSSPYLNTFRNTWSTIEKRSLIFFSKFSYNFILFLIDYIHNKHHSFLKVNFNILIRKGEIKIIVKI